MDSIQLQVLDSKITLRSSGGHIPAVSLMDWNPSKRQPTTSSELWDELPELIRQSLRQLHSIHQSDSIALAIDTQDSQYAGWPWELLRPEAQSPLVPFACMPHIPLVRAYRSAHTAPPIRPGVLRVLVVTATPRGLPPVNSVPLLSFLRKLHNPNSIVVSVREHCSVEKFSAALTADQPDLLIMLAHGQPGKIMFEDQTGDMEVVPTQELAIILTGSTVRVAAIASCNSATFEDGGQSIAAALLDTGLLGVVAMNGTIAFETSSAFIEGLLQGIAKGEALEVAAARGRQQIVATLGTKHQDWLLPVCWQRVIGRPLVLSPSSVIRQGAKTLTERAPSLAGALATGGWLGLLAVTSLQSLFLPQTIAVPALLKLLEQLGLNVMAGYLGNVLQDIWRQTGKQPEEYADMINVTLALRKIARDNHDAAAQLVEVARKSGALQQTLDAIQAGAAGGNAVLVGLKRDSEKHNLLLAEIKVDLQELFRETKGIQVDAKLIQKDTQIIREKLSILTKASQQEYEKNQALLLDYCGSIVALYRDLRFSRLVDAKRGSDEQSSPRLYLEDVYISLTTNGPPKVLREDVRTVKSLRRLMKYYAPERHGSRKLPPDKVRFLRYQMPSLDLQRNSWLQMANQSADGWFEDYTPLPSSFNDEWKCRVRVLRPQLAVEAMASSAQKAKRLVLLGDPGSGKSTVLRYVAVLLAEAMRVHHLSENLIGWSERRIPLLVTLGNMRLRLNEQSDTLAALFSELIEVLEGPGGGSNRLRPGLGEFLPQILRRSVLLLDGLDELSAEAGPNGEISHRHRVVEALRRLSQQLPETPIITTCRIMPYRTRDVRAGVEAWQFSPDDEWEERVIQPFEYGQVRQFVENWYQTDAFFSGATQYSDIQNYGAERSRNLLTALETNPSLQEAIAPSGSAIATTRVASPLLLTMLTILHYNAEGGPLPVERDGFYEEFVKLLLHRWEPRRSLPAYTRDDLLTRLTRLGITGLINIDPLRLVLHEVAYEAHRDAHTNDGRGIINKDQLSHRLIRYFRDNLYCSDQIAVAAQKIFLDALVQEAGLLLALGDNTYALPHLTFQEYLAACHLAEHPQMVDLVYDHWNSRDSDRWRVVILLLMGRLRQQGKVTDKGIGWLDRLINAEWLTEVELDDSKGTSASRKILFQEESDKKKKDWRQKSGAQRQRDAMLAADCYLALGRGSYLGAVRNPRMQEKWLQDALLSIIPSPESSAVSGLHLSPEERNRAALFLVQFGESNHPDPRLGVCSMKPDWVGAFSEKMYLIGSLTDKYNNRSYSPQQLQLKNFSISRYPVTTWQFRQFWEDEDGYRNGKWWTWYGRQWKEEMRDKLASRWDELVSMPPNYTLAGVCWYEAVAFCKWLTERGQDQGWLDYEHIIRLPTEAEWEIAATLGSIKDSPRVWQLSAHEIRHNVKEAGLNGPVAVGLFPNGASPCGALDMSGNVWEWCCSVYRSYPQLSNRPVQDFNRGGFGPILRGGSYNLPNDIVTSGARDPGAPDDQYSFRGFRVCMTEKD